MFTRAWSSRVVGLFSPNWRQCLGYSIIVRSFHIPPQKDSPMIWLGGSTFSNNPPFPDPSQAPLNFTMSELFRTQVQESGSPSSYMASGEPGVSSQDGRPSMVNATFNGRRLSASNALSAHSARSPVSNDISPYTVTTKESLKGGGTAAVETPPSTTYSSESMLSALTMNSLTRSIHNTLRAKPTQLTHHPEASIHPHPFFSHPSLSLHTLIGSSSTHNSHTHLLSRECGERDATPQPSPNASTILTNVLKQTYDFTPDASRSQSPTGQFGMTDRPSKFNSQLPTSSLSRRQPRNYHPNLTPITSVLRPHCLVGERLRLWTPIHPRSESRTLAEISDDDFDRILSVINSAWAPATRDCYGSGLLVFHVFCDTRNIPEDQRCPASPLLIISFISSCAGSYAGSTLDNYISGIRAWHILHGQAWAMDDAQIRTALAGAANLAPPSSKRPKRAPVTVEIMTKILAQLDLSNPLDAAVAACLTTSFYSLARTGEFTVPSVDKFNSSIHVTRASIRDDQDRHGLKVKVFRIPRTKSSPTGEDLYWATQEGPTDPRFLLTNHFTINNLPPTTHLYAYRHRKSFRPLTKTAFMGRLTTAALLAGIDSIKGHGIRIGSTLEYLLRGVPFDVVKSMGRWSSEAFVLYLRKHAIILAPYMQGHPILEPFTRYTMPPVRRH